MTFANKMNRQFQAVSRRQDEMEEKMEGNIRETRQNSQEIEKLREELNKMKSTLESEREAKNDMLGEELRDREARRNNLIIHGLQEPDQNTNPRERMERDRQLCGELLAAIGTRTRAADLKFCRRVGERGREARPMVIGVRSEEEKRSILDRAADLRRTRFSSFSGPRYDENAEESRRSVGKRSGEKERAANNRGQGEESEVDGCGEARRKENGKRSRKGAAELRKERSTAG
jgi:hypothetical protein